MNQFNVDFFDRTLTNVHHDTIDALDDLDDDYLSAGATDITIDRTTLLSKGQFVYVGGSAKFFGIISDINNEGEDNTTVVSVKPFITMFDQEVLFNTNYQNNSDYPIEKVLETIINNNWVNNKDELQKMSCLSVTTTSSTEFAFNIKSDQEDSHYTIVELYSTLIVKAMSKLGVAIDVDVDFSTKKINLTIGTHSDSIYIDADLPNVKCTQCKVHDFGDSTNKLVIWDTSNYTTSATYYLHTDGSYDTNDSDRVTPVNQDDSTATASDDKDFTTAASEVASNTFSGIEWTDDIELEVYVDDTLINPLDLKYGQQVNVIRDGMSYGSIFTGRKFNNEIVTLMFGTVRSELTKQLRLNS